MATAVVLIERACVDFITPGRPWMIPDTSRRWATTEARLALASRFRLPYDPFMQDWEWEVADPCRFEEFLDAYSSGDLTDDERFSLMEMLIQSVEEMNLPAVGPSPQWQAIASRLLAHPELHFSSVRYWSCLDGQNLDDCFRVSGSMRTVWQAIQGTTAGSET